MTPSPVYRHETKIVKGIFNNVKFKFKLNAITLHFKILLHFKTHHTKNIEPVPIWYDGRFRDKKWDPLEEFQFQGGVKTLSFSRVAIFQKFDFQYLNLH